MTNKPNSTVVDRHASLCVIGRDVQAEAETLAFGERRCRCVGFVVKLE